MKNKEVITLIIALLVIGGLIAWGVIDSKTPGKYDELAICLEEKGATFFGAFWCPHCIDQKSMFGKSADLLPYVECSTSDRGQTEECEAEGITNYPTWEFPNGERQTGAIPPNVLASLTNCPLPEGEEPVSSDINIEIGSSPVEGTEEDLPEPGEEVQSEEGEVNEEN